MKERKSNEGCERGSSPAVLGWLAIWPAVGLFVCVFFLVGVAFAQTPSPPPLPSFGVAGSVSSEGLDNPTNLLARRPVQAPLLRAADSGVARAKAEQALAGIVDFWRWLTRQSRR